MRKTFILLASFILLLSSCKNNLKVKGDLSGAPDQAVFLEHFYLDSFIVLDEIQMIDGKFKLEVEPKYPSLLRLRFGLGKYIFLSIAESDKSIDIKGLWSNLDEKEIEGSESTEDLNKFIHKMQVFASKQNAYIMVVNELKGDPSKDSLYQDASNKILSSNKDFELGVENYIDNSPYLLNKLFVLNLLSASVRQDYMDKTLLQLKEEYPDNEELEYSIMKINPHLMDGQGSKEQAPEITGKDPEGKRIKLSDFRGKYVLVDFWASWCAPCRAENPNVVKLYQEFKDQNFTILGVSLDRSAEPWKKAITKDNLTWNHSSELLGWQAISVRDYHIESIPSNVLVDPDGNIIARDKSTEELSKILSQSFQKLSVR